jgi:hypothetical protein
LAEIPAITTEVFCNYGMLVNSMEKNLTNITSFLSLIALNYTNINKYVQSLEVNADKVSQIKPQLLPHPLPFIILNNHTI